MTRVHIEPAWHVGPQKQLLDPLLFRLLQSIHDSGSLAQAARAIGLSYRHLWSQMGKWEAVLGQPLARLERGRGAKLTAFGEKLLTSERRARERLAPALAEAASQFERDLGSAGEIDQRHLAIHASHDLALAQLRDSLDGNPGLKLDLQFHASAECLAALSRGRCDLAGFHVTEQESAPELARLLKPGVHMLIGVAIREQGLIVGRGNPKRIQGLRDLARRGVRFVNRQQGSGTRLAFDRLLELAQIEPQRLQGYRSEEFTHLAVAATVASGMADAGFGIHAAAAQYGLGFIPIVSERYLLACRSERAESAAMREFLALLRGPGFREIIAGLPGYDDAITGKVMAVGDALGGPRPGRRAEAS